MSGPVTALDAPPTVADCSHPSAPCVELSDSRDEQVGKIRVRRALPRKGRRTVGAWCFADHMGPADVTENSGLDVGPHPHIGLQTVTWLTDGQVLHRDSLGSEQVIKPGQLNLMTSGSAVTHAEEATGHYRGTLEGIQLWVALPEASRHGAASFEHHADLPQTDLEGTVATVLVGAFADLSSPARHDTPWSGSTWPCTSPARFPCDQTSSTPSWCSKVRSASTASCCRPASWPTSAAVATSCASTSANPPGRCCSVVNPSRSR